MTFDAEHRAATEGALIHPRTDLAVFAVTGKDRLSWLNGLVTQDVGKLASGAGAYSLAVGKTGRIMAELWIVGGADRVYVVVARDRLEMIRQHFDKHLIMEDAEIGDALDRDVLFLHGPLARDLVGDARTFGADAAMVDWTGRGDAAVVLAPEGKRTELEDALFARAGRAGATATDEAWESIRIAWGLPRFGVDFDEQSLPQEAALERVAVSFSKGCYLGQETVFMLEKRGHARRRLARIAVEGADAVAAGAEIALADDGAVGTVTSATPGGEGTLALGYVKFKHASVGTALVIAGRPARIIGLAADPVAKA
ncbi:Folate-dependent protein for Fe/S cluster synthesis/repair in oxidative stress [Minicystis rosea]|nr:Folate-dependent protein for Fe/S cluster synthesis/repair in oxidative stress [Minicystis rosea]